jgi:hypothetical protein
MEEIKIIKETGCFIVHQGKKNSGPLGYDEMLGLISSLTMSEDRPCLKWMRTEEEHKKLRNWNA